MPGVMAVQPPWFSWQSSLTCSPLTIVSIANTTFLVLLPTATPISPPPWNLYSRESVETTSTFNCSFLLANPTLVNTKTVSSTQAYFIVLPSPCGSLNLWSAFFRLYRSHLVRATVLKAMLLRTAEDPTHSRSLRMSGPLPVRRTGRGGERLDTAVGVSDLERSFHYVAASLRDAATLY